MNSSAGLHLRSASLVFVLMLLLLCLSASTIAQAQTSQFTLTVTKTGTGTGTVSSNPSGISCGADCTQDYVLNTQGALTVTPSTSSIFDGWSGDPDCTDGVVSMDSAKTCAAAFEQSSGQFTLILTKAGTGTGTVTTNPAGVNCGGDCTENYNGNTLVTLAVVPSANSVFAGWSGNGDCSDGIIVMDANKTCTAAFNVPRLTVSRNGTGAGTVSSSPAGIDCGADCTEDYSPNTLVTLTPTPSAGSVFAGWSGHTDCSDGVVTTDAIKTCTATFNKTRLSVSKSGTGTGTVTSSPAGINCGADCTEDYAVNTQVTLTATPSVGSTFVAWSGNADCSDGVVTMDAPKTCTATFNTPRLTVTRSGAGSGTVTSTPAGISCGSDCSENYALNTQVTLTAAPSSGSTFSGWSGNADCSDGVVTMDVDKTCTATFETGDTTPPVITATVSPIPNAARWNNTDVTVTFTCSDSGSGVASCPNPISVQTEGASQVISGTATDRAGNTADTSVTLKIDKTLPTVGITSPTNGATLNASPVSVTGTADDTLSGITSVTCNGSQASLSSSTFNCNVSLLEGSNTITVQATDVAGNAKSSSIDVTLNTDQTPPTLSIDSPNQPVIDDATPEITITYSDDDSRVNLNTLKVLIDTADITSSCIVNTTSATCQSPTLADGQHRVSSEIRDLAGNTATTSFSFGVNADGGDLGSGMIGVGGGGLQVTLPDETIVTLAIPPGALTEDTEIMLTPVSESAFPDPGDGSAGSGFGVDFEPDGLEFLIPAALKYEYTDDVISALANELGTTPDEAEQKRLSTILVLTRCLPKTCISR